MKCPNCGAEDQSGKFCAACGAGLDVTCASCGTDVPAGARFCTACGEPVAGGDADGARAGNLAPWIIAGVAMLIVVVLVVVFLPGETRTRAPASGGSTEAPFMGSGGEEGAGSAGPGSDMRANADQLFNRIMMAAEEGDEAEVSQFMPMAIQAYGMVDDLDDDGIFHLGMLHLTAGSHGEALQAAERILDGSPDHLLGLALAAQAEAGAGDAARAAEYWERFLDAYDAEAGKPLPEYVDHQPLLPEYRQLAREAVGGQ